MARKPSKTTHARRLLSLTVVPTTTGENILSDDFGGLWEHINAYFGDRSSCGGCGCTDFSGWRRLTTGELRCNDCVTVSRPTSKKQTRSR